MLSDKYTPAELADLALEYEQERIRLYDERTAYRRLIRDQARRETFAEALIRRVREKMVPLDYKGFTGIQAGAGDNDIVITLTDVHHGIDINNTYNIYNTDVLRNRLNEYIDKILTIQKRHGSKRAYVILSELISGLIHPTLRIENNEDVIDQVLTVCELVGQFLSEISGYFDTVYVAMAPGNHGRVNPNKDQDLAHENFDNFILPYLQALLQNYKNISYIQNDIEQSMAVFAVRGYLVVGAHGDRDRLNTAAQRLTLFLGRQPDYIFLGHMHYNAMRTDAGTKIIQSGSLSGMDEYCLTKRLRGNPEQVIAVINDDGLDCIYDVKFKS